MLAPRPAGTKAVDAVVVGGKVHLDIFRLGHYRHRRGAGVDTSLRLGLGDTLDPVSAAFELQLAETAFPLDAEDDLFEAAHFGRAGRHQFGLPAAVVAVVLVHLEQVAGEQCRLVAAGSRADLHNAAGSVGVGPADCHIEQLVPERLTLALELGNLHRGEFTHLRVAAAG